MKSSAAVVEFAPVAPLQKLGEAANCAQRRLQVVANDVCELRQFLVRPLQCLQ